MVRVVSGGRLPEVLREGRTAMPVLRSRTTGGLGRRAPGCSRAIARANRSYAASDRSVPSRWGRPAHEAQAIITRSTTPEGSNHARISTDPQ